MPFTDIIYSDLSTWSITASEVAETNNPVRNLLNYFADETWFSSTDTQGQTLTIDLGSIKAIDCMVLDNHNLINLTVSGNIQLQAANNYQFTSSSAVVISNVSATSSQASIFEFDETSRRYWRLLFNGELQSAPYVGNLYLSKKLNFGYSYSFPYENENEEYNTTEFSNIKGTIRNDSNHEGRKIYKFNFKMLTDTFRTNFLTFLNTIKGIKPFYFRDVNQSLRLVKLTGNYNPFSIMNYNLNDLLQFNMKSLYTNVDYSVPELEIIFILESEEFIDTVI